MASTSDYWIGETIGEGSFGVVIYGRHKVSDLHVAIKFVDKHSLRRKPDVALAVVQEQRLLKRLKTENQKQHHQHQQNQQDTAKTSASEIATATNETSSTTTNNNFIVDLYASFHDTECVYLVLECCSGGTLQELLDHYSRKASAESCSVSTNTANIDPTIAATTLKLVDATRYYGIQLVDGLRFIHTCNIIHCDMKPSNILLTSCGCIKIADFGGAVDLLSGTTSTHKSAVNSTTCNTNAVTEPQLSSNKLNRTLPRGTAAFAAPELNQQEGAVTTAVDLWSLGCILYACLPFTDDGCYKSPFDHGSEVASIQAQKEYCSTTDASSRYTLLFSKKKTLEDGDVKTIPEGDTVKDSLKAFQVAIAELLNPIAVARIQCTKNHHKSGNELPSSSQIKGQSDSIVDQILYANLRRKMIGDNGDKFEQRQTHFLPPTPSWWTKNSVASVPTSKSASTTDATTTKKNDVSTPPHQSSTVNLTTTTTVGFLVDGAIGWSAFLA